jgi:hypothetical protein
MQHLNLDRQQIAGRRSESGIGGKQLKKLRNSLFSNDQRRYCLMNPNCLWMERKRNATGVQLVRKPCVHLYGIRTLALTIALGEWLHTLATGAWADDKDVFDIR